jgi:RNA polymerase sigma-70 factor (ECF subfamily)
MNEQEKRLVESVLEGETDAFEPLVLPYRQALLTLALRLSRNIEDAREISQEALMRAFKYLRTFDTEKSFKNWLFGILMNAAHQHGRKARPAGAGVRIPLSPENERQLRATDNPERDHRQGEFKSMLMDCLDGLSRREREVFLLRDIEERSIRETAEILRSSSVSVRVHLSAARRKIKDRIRERFPELAEGWR